MKPEILTVIVVVATRRQAIEAIQRGISLMEEGRYDTVTNAQIILNELTRERGGRPPLVMEMGPHQPAYGYSEPAELKDDR